MLVVDTGPILALLNADDDWHERCARMFAIEEGPFFVPTTVLIELDYLLRRQRVELWTTFFDDLQSGEYLLEVLTDMDYDRAITLCRHYRYMNLQLADASIVALCERLGQKRVATVDRRDFTRIVPAHCPAFTLLP